MPRRFLIHFDQLTIDRQSVKTGKNSPDVISACRSINVALFLSHGLRRDVEVTIASGTLASLETITFPGETLKRVSPDERSISFFLLKAQGTLDEMHVAKNILDNGIVVRKTTVDTLLKEWDTEMVCLSTEEGNATENPTLSCDGVFIYEVDSDVFSERLQTKTIYRLPKPLHPERFILDVNLICDSQR